MRLIGEAAGQSDLGERRSPGPDQLGRTLDPNAAQAGQYGFAGRGPEGAREVLRREPHRCGIAEHRGSSIGCLCFQPELFDRGGDERVADPDPGERREVEGIGPDKRPTRAAATTTPMASQLSCASMSATAPAGASSRSPAENEARRRLLPNATAPRKPRPRAMKSTSIASRGPG
jgi:hypothetical protein